MFIVKIEKWSGINHHRTACLYKKFDRKADAVAYLERNGFTKRYTKGSDFWNGQTLSFSAYICNTRDLLPVYTAEANPYKRLASTRGLKSIVVRD